MEEDRLIMPGYRPEDDETERSLRPKTLDDYVGQTEVKESLRIYLQAALKRHDPLDHILLYGPPGLGKTTLAGIIAAEMGQNIRITSGPAIERAGDLASILTNLNAGDVLFIDEIHRLSHTVEEVLYSAMEDYALDIMIGKGPSARSIRVDLPKFTLVGATTRAGLLTAPLRDRFGILFRLQLYSTDELTQIVTNSARILGVPADDEGLREIARRSRGTPRIANRLLRRVRLRAGEKRRPHHVRGRARRSGHAAHRRPGTGQRRPRRAARDDGKIRRRPRRARHAGRDDRRGRDDDRGRIRAVSFAAGVHHAHPARKNRNRSRV